MDVRNYSPFLSSSRFDSAQDSVGQNTGLVFVAKSDIKVITEAPTGTAGGAKKKRAEAKG